MPVTVSCIPSPTPADPMDGIYPVAAQADAEQVLEQAYEGLVPQLTFAFLDEDEHRAPVPPWSMKVILESEELEEQQE